MGGNVNLNATAVPTGKSAETSVDPHSNEPEKSATFNHRKVRSFTLRSFNILPEERFLVGSAKILCNMAINIMSRKLGNFIAHLDESSYKIKSQISPTTDMLEAVTTTYKALQGSIDTTPPLIIFLLNNALNSGSGNNEFITELAKSYPDIKKIIDSFSRGAFEKITAEFSEMEQPFDAAIFCLAFMFELTPEQILELSFKDSSYAKELQGEDLQLLNKFILMDNIYQCTEYNPSFNKIQTIQERLLLLVSSLCTETEALLNADILHEASENQEQYIRSLKIGFFTLLSQLIKEEVGQEQKHAIYTNIMQKLKHKHASSATMKPILEKFDSLVYKNDIFINSSNDSKLLKLYKNIMGLKLN